MDQDTLDQLKTLHTRAIDARNGYQEALDEAEGHGCSALFHDMIALHEGHSRALAAELTKAGETPDDGGSFMSLVHEAIMNVRALFNSLDESVLPGLIDGEKRNVETYDDALRAITSPPLATLLTAQRDELRQQIAKMEAQQADFERAAAEAR